ncbi:hypothetical protein GCM10012289_53280 [Nonomuraea cavernae]|uniref:Uncharacterized protein n=2 Tax=Nonomuraea cavernae TaxID=2045107 RepID=A0A917Z735_9ACTN|nr:hypothetical protein GCM10012289_53280 [Nonomuraea cavernae]
MAPAPAYSAATELTIREINVRPAEPVVGVGDSVRLLVDVIVKGARGKDGVTIKVEPGPPPKPAPTTTPAAGTPGATGQQAGWDRTRPEGRPATVVPQTERRPEPRPIHVNPAAARLAAPASDRGAEAWETWRFLPDKGLNRFYPAGTWTVTATAKGADGATVTEYASFQLRRDTRLTGVRVARARGSESVRVNGSLTRVGPKGLADYAPFTGQEVEILRRQGTTGSWERAGTATTGERGDFTGTVQGRTGDYWQVRYPGTGHYAAALSSVHQIPQ